jgi:DNA-binding MarR family transcriptional regulator
MRPSIDPRADARAYADEDRPVSTGNLGFLLAKSSQRWNELLTERFAAAGFPEVRAAYGSLLIPLFEEDGLRQGELARRARLSKQTLTTMARALERDGLVYREVDPSDGRATLIFLTPRARAFQEVAEDILSELDALVTNMLGKTRVDELKADLAALVDFDR